MVRVALPVAAVLCRAPMTSALAATPKGFQQLSVGNFTVAPPKKRRKGHDHCFRVDIADIEEQDVQGRKFILSAISAEEMSSWLEIFKKIESDAPAEQDADIAVQVCAVKRHGYGRLM